IRKIEKAGQRGTSFCEVSFDGAAVPASALVGEEGMAWKQLVPLLTSERTAFAAVAIGLATAAFEDAFRYAGERSAFGRRIGQFQAIQHHLANMRTLIDTAQL